MKKYLSELNMKLFFYRICKPILFSILLVSGEKTFAQQSQIAIVNLADSTLIYKHIGYTKFANKSDTFDCQFNCKKYIDQELTRILSSKYSVGLLPIPNSLLSSNGTIFNSSEIKKEVKLWISSLKNQYDFIIFIETVEQDDYMDKPNQKLQSSGLYSRGNPAQSWVAVYSTTRFSLVRTSNLEIPDYGSSEMDYLLPLKEYQFSRDNVLIDTEMLPIIKAELAKLLDYKLEYFVTNSFLISNDDYSRLKLIITE